MSKASEWILSSKRRPAIFLPGGLVAEVGDNGGLWIHSKDTSSTASVFLGPKDVSAVMVWLDDTYGEPAS